MIRHKSDLRKIKMPRHYRVIINYMLRGGYEANLSIVEADADERPAMHISPGPDGYDMGVPIRNIENVVNVNLTTIKLELYVPAGAQLTIKFGSLAAKSEVCRFLRADSDEDSGMSSGSPSPPVANDLN